MWSRIILVEYCTFFFLGHSKCPSLPTAFWESWEEHLLKSIIEFSVKSFVVEDLLPVAYKVFSYFYEDQNSFWFTSQYLFFFLVVKWSLPLCSTIFFFKHIFNKFIHIAAKALYFEFNEIRSSLQEIWLSIIYTKNNIDNQVSWRVDVISLSSK